MAALEAIADPDFVTELGQFNLEINVPPARLREGGLSTFEETLRRRVAAMAEGFFFSLLDPGDIQLGGMHLPLEPLAAYTLGFLMFWLFCALACMLSYYLANVPADQKPPL